MSNNNKDASLVESMILHGDLKGMSPQQKIQYYNGYCQRLGLDPFTKPFDILKLNGKETLYCTRSGCQQLNKIHNVSHSITSRELIADAGVYQVTAKASLPDGRFTESIGAVGIKELKGEAYANAIMKAETKSKRRATLDLLGLGVLDETEVETIPKAQTEQIQVIHAEVMTEEEVEEVDEEVRRMYNDQVDLLQVLERVTTMQQITNLYMFNQHLVDKNKEILKAFSNKKNQIK